MSEKEIEDKINILSYRFCEITGDKPTYLIVDYDTLEHIRNTKLYTPSFTKEKLEEGNSCMGLIISVIFDYRKTVIEVG